MIISYEHKFIFIHIPKTGGLAITKTILPTGTRLSEKCHETECKSNLDFFRFAFARNPWDRFASMYLYFKKFGQGKSSNDLHSGEIVNRFDSFRNFTINLNNVYSEFKSSHWQSQTAWFESRVDFIGRFESLQEDFNIVCGKIGIPKQKLPHENKSKHKHYTEYYDDETREIVAEKYAKDIEYFGYKFGE